MNIDDYKKQLDRLWLLELKVAYRMRRTADVLLFVGWATLVLGLGSIVWVAIFYPP